MTLSEHPVLMVMAIAVIASLLSEVRVGLVRIPAVVWLMLLGIAIGPDALAIAKPSPLLHWFERAGLSALFFSAGLDLDLDRVRGDPLRLAAEGWLWSFGLGLAISLALNQFNLVNAPTIVSLVLTTTAVGTFIPILRDAGRIETRFGALVVAAGAMGEFGPVIVVSLVITRQFGAWQTTVLMLGYVALALGAAVIALRYRSPKVVSLLSRALHSSTQLPVCLSVLLLAIFASLSETIGLEAVLGAFSAGMIIGLASRGESADLFREKLDAIGFGVFIPFFFVVSGMNLNVRGLVQDLHTLLLIPLFLSLFLIVRGAPVLLYTHHLTREQRWPFSLYSATALPMVVAISDIGVRTGRLPSNTAAALVGSGLLSVLLFPAIAEALLSRSQQGQAQVDSEPFQQAKWNEQTLPFHPNVTPHFFEQ